MNGKLVFAFALGVAAGVWGWPWAATFYQAYIKKAP
jgi:hypothetical protein